MLPINFQQIHSSTLEWCLQAKNNKKNIFNISNS